MNISSYINEGVKARQSINPQEIEEIANIIVSALKNGKKVIAFGNGGSAADAQHFVAELVGKFLISRKPYKAIALTTNTSILTAIGNDYGFEEVFSRQIQALADKGDVVIGISTSGSSENVVNAVIEANKRGAYTIALTGKSGGKLKGYANKTIFVNSELTPIIQETHITILHLICMLVERKLE
ncbi:MAG: D-sedoheptulose 7-phosphate isomerase [Thermoplasmatales archaeon]|nr:D-sedoheptulose 7-phosphate isomerase [Thermoplasmatales archaeon]